MKRKERFLTALMGQQPDRVPMFDFLFQQPLYEALIGRRPETYNAPDVVACALALGHDAVWLRLSPPTGWQPRWLDESTHIDEWGTVFRQSASSWPFDAPVDYPISGREDLRRYRLPNPTLPGRNAELAAFWQTGHDDLALTAGVSGPFTRAWHLLGYERICYALYDDPGLLVEIFRLTVDYAKELARRCAAAGCHAIWLMEDLGDNARGFMKSAHFAEYYFNRRLIAMSYADGWAAIHLEMPPRVPRTEFSAWRYWDLIRVVTGVSAEPDSPPEVRQQASNAFMKAWNFDLRWATLISSDDLAECRTDMGHAEYDAGGADRRDAISCPFKTPEEALAFDPWGSYGPRDQAELTRRFEEHYRQRCAETPDCVNMTGIYITLVSGLIEIFGWEMLLLAAGTDPARFGRLTDRYAAWIQQYFEALAAADVPVPCAHSLEQAATPDWDDIGRAALATVAY